MSLLSAEEKEAYATDNYRLIHHYAQKYYKPNYDYNDIYGAGQFGMTKALNTYDKTKKVKFATYASQCIVNEIFMFFRNEKKHLNNISIDTPIYTDGGNEISILDSLAAEDYVDELEEVRPAFSKVIDALQPRDKTIMDLLFDGKKQVDIGKELGISKAYVSRIVKRTMEKVKEEYARDLTENVK